jgi:hypothetical protein
MVSRDRDAIIHGLDGHVRHFVFLAVFAVLDGLRFRGDDLFCHDYLFFDGCLATAAFATLTALPSSPLLASTAFAVALHCFFFAGVFAFLSCFALSDGCHGAIVCFLSSRLDRAQ